MEFVITTDIEENNGSCNGCAFELTNEMCTNFCPGMNEIFVITKIDYFNLPRSATKLNKQNQRGKRIKNKD